MRTSIKLLTLLLLLLALSSCEMMSTDRTGVLELHIERQASSRDLTDATYLAVIAYPSYDDNLTTIVDLLDTNLRDSIFGKTNTLTFDIDLTTTQNATLIGIDPGKWNFIILSFWDALGDLSSFTPYDCYSYKIIKNYDVMVGYNYIDAELVATYNELPQ